MDESEQNPLLDVTTYVEVAAGETEITEPEDPLLHAYDPPPDAVSVDASPEQSVVEVAEIETVGDGSTLNAATELSLQVPMETSTEYEELVAGVTMIEEVVAPVFHT